MLDCDGMLSTNKIDRCLDWLTLRTTGDELALVLSCRFTASHLYLHRNLLLRFPKDEIIRANIHGLYNTLARDVREGLSLARSQEYLVHGHPQKYKRDLAFTKRDSLDGLWYCTCKIIAKYGNCPHSRDMNRASRLTDSRDIMLVGPWTGVHRVAYAEAVHCPEVGKDYQRCTTYARDREDQWTHRTDAPIIAERLKPRPKVPKELRYRPAYEAWQEGPEAKDQWKRGERG